MTDLRLSCSPAGAPIVPRAAGVLHLPLFIFILRPRSRSSPIRSRPTPDSPPSLHSTEPFDTDVLLCPRVSQPPACPIHSVSALLRLFSIPPSTTLNSFPFTLFRTLLHSSKMQLFCFHEIPHSFTKTPGGGGLPQFRYGPG